MTSNVHSGFRSFLTKLSIYLLILVLLWLSSLVVAANLTGRLQEYCRRYTNIPVGTARRGGSSLERFKEIDGYKNLDILFVGSSHCYRGIDTRLFESHGLLCFNMGSTNQTPLNSFYLLKPRIADLNPKTMVIEIYPEVLSESGLESFLDLTENLPISEDIVRMSIAVGRMRSINALLTRCFEFGRPSIDIIESNPFLGDSYIKGGYVEKTDRFEGVRYVSPHEIVIRDEQIGYLTDIISMAKKRSAKVLLIIQPLPKETMDATLNYREVVEVIKNLAISESVGFVDFNSLLSFESRRDFYDADHLRQRGVKIFNSLLYEILVDSGYVIPEADISSNEK